MSLKYVLIKNKTDFSCTSLQKYKKKYRYKTIFFELHLLISLKNKKYLMKFDNFRKLFCLLHKTENKKIK